MPRAVRLDLLYEDRHLVVANKPAGLLTIPSGPGRGSVEDTLLGRAQLYARHKRGRLAYAGMLHRLDRGTSGAVAVALSREMHEAGRNLFHHHHFERKYLAIVGGTPERDSGTIDERISSTYEDGKRRLVGAAAPGMFARTHYRVLEMFGPATLMELELDTGRQHQIRLHLMSLGHQILGEKVYGDEATASPGVRTPRLPHAPRVMLHAAWLAFPHPITGLRVEVAAPVPRDFEQVLERLRRTARHTR